MIQLAETSTLAAPHTDHPEPYIPSGRFHLTHSEQMHIYTTGWFDLACFAALGLLLCIALFA